MIPLNSAYKSIAKSIKKYALEEGPNDTPVAGVYCIKFSEDQERLRRRWRSCLGFVIQGAKEIELENASFVSKAGDFTATPLDLPVFSQAKVKSKAEPFLGLLIAFDYGVLRQLVREIDIPRETNPPPHDGAVFVGHCDAPMAKALARLTETFADKEAAKVMAPLIIKEIFYLMLKTPQGRAVAPFLRADTGLNKITLAIEKIKSNLAQTIDVELLAKEAHMSRAVFFKQFKKATSMSPIQYQKRLRLLEARRILSEENETAESAAYRVGYNSASQFSREYLRLFKATPLQDRQKSL